MVKKFSAPHFGYEVEIGAVAQQADGAVWFKHGGTVILATIVSAPSEEFPGFLPLTVEYREQFSAAGKIPGGYYKREGKATDKEILTGRLIDRAIRPLFPSNYFNQLQLLVTVYSVDKEHAPNTIALNAASMALAISKIPFLGPVGVVEVGRLNGEWIFGPLYAQALQSDVRLVIAGTEEGICMVEGSAKEISEHEFVDVLFKAHAEIKKLVAWQKEVVAEVGVSKEAITDMFDWKLWSDRVEKHLTDEVMRSFFVADKVTRNERIEKVREAIFAQYKAEMESAEVSDRMVDYVFDTLVRNKITESVFALNKRVDGRAFDQVRSISVEVGMLPYTHGSSLFQRGNTQALVSVTLGSGQDEQRIEELMDGELTGSFMLHYNFPPFASGEVKPMRGPSRRDVGHGYLAASSLRFLLPDKESFPYTIRVVSDILESDGSSSMATVCGSTMGLMHAGVPLKKMVAGVAMGLLRDSRGTFKVLTDIAGFEDEFGFMDFKVAGTEEGITAIQMDIKYKGGFAREIFEQALVQARAGRLFILGEMKKVLSAPNPKLSDLVPKLLSLKIPTDKIGVVIGTGGKTIREISERTRTEINIDGSDGLVRIFGAPGADLEGACRWINTLVGNIEAGSRYQGKIRRFAEFGIFVELVPGQDGLVHISNIPRQYQRTFSTHFKLDDTVLVEVVEYDPVSERIRLRLIDEEK